MDLNYLFHIEEGGYIRLPRKLVDLILDHITSCPCGFAIHRRITAVLRPVRITYPQLQTRGLQIPEDKRPEGN